MQFLTQSSALCKNYNPLKTKVHTRLLGPQSFFLYDCGTKKVSNIFPGLHREIVKCLNNKDHISLNDTQMDNVIETETDEG